MTNTPTNRAPKKTRTVVLHYHLFKNAGTSVDQMLKSYFGETWVTAEFAAKDKDNTALVETWIAANPDARAFSSHTMVGPLPQVAGVEVIPVVLLREPISRIASAYRFERKQKVDNWGANLAKTHDLAGYVRERLANSNDRQCRNFQTSRLASLVPGSGAEIDRATDALDLVHGKGVLGRVEAFDAFTDALTARLAPLFDGFAPQVAKANTTETTRPELDRDLKATLEDANRDDTQLVAYADTLLKQGKSD